MCFLFCLDITFCFQSLCTKYSSACSTTDGVVGQSYKFPVINGIFSETAYGNSHSVFIVDIQRHLRTVVLFHVTDELLRSAGKIQFLGNTFKVYQTVNELLFGRFLFEFYKYGSGMTVQHRNTDTLAGDHRADCRNDNAILDLSPETERLFLTLLFLSCR